MRAAGQSQLVVVSEIRLRLRSPDLVFVDEGRVPPLRLLDGREAQPVYIGYRCPHAGPVQTTLWLELDLCDHRGEWHAYDNRCRDPAGFYPAD